MSYVFHCCRPGEQESFGAFTARNKVCVQPKVTDM
jgi:hypothetical protein